ncbi:Response regulator c-di-GMP phosphodiesterase, RpfG family, contains REC and HD-GYP domains [Roseateles sp. YR242]|uniref:HD domain-containing phosphohydrolase n=1 Tax=Roseateles sp. YR242 TaxID=1855305 RepID=UPI0008D8BF51|nr:HD domain-containing phosphohydrolase [Roseateles sp. YR242]SEL89301.1 Response regulator c-di-GMP phosphodiesterase, RpfG family, contains REC and HD-GYP domains [Roseateles sp. YR242]
MTAETDHPTVLFVDDEPSILSSLRRLVHPQGYRVLLATSGAEALQQLAQEPVDLVVSDMRMPEMDGAEFLEQVRTRWPLVGRILLTGYADIQATVAAVNRGQIQRHIAKPWDDQELLTAIDDALARRRLELENRALLSLTTSQNEELQRLNTDLSSRVLERTRELEQSNAKLAQSVQQVKDNFLLSIQVFSGLLELREGGLAGYSRQVADLARRTVRRLGLGPQQEEDVHSAGLLHEIGKIGFPDSLLRKPASLMNADETSRYRRHTLNAEAALLPLAQLQDVARLVRSQHERLDGKGFPDGLIGNAIPLAAQALSISSDYHAALSGRLSEEAHSLVQALTLVRGGAGTRYDSDVVKAFLLALEDKPEDVPRDQQVSPAGVEPGMVLARDLLTPKGTLLLAAGFVFDARMVKQIREFAGREGARMTIFIVRPEDKART